MIARGRRRVLALTLGAALVAGACGGDSASLVDTTTPAADTDGGTDAADAGPTATLEPPGDAGETPADPTADAEATATPSPTPTFEPSGDPAFTADSKLSTVGLDEVFFGMTVDEAGQAADTGWQGLPDGTAPECYAISPAGGPRGVVFTVFQGRIERVDIENPELRTRSGAGLGSTEKELIELFGRRLSPPVAVEGGNRFEFVPQDEAEEDLRIVFVTDGTVVRRLWAGRLPIAEPAQPCT